ncbi:hypothetical protein I6Y99_004419 [Vibrio parahaemolyticus]|nr:hypothetical protein [Vibrio parahaemolyticus]
MKPDKPDGFTTMKHCLEIPQHSSKTALLASLQQAQDHLLHEPHTPLDLLISIQESIDAVDGGRPKIKTRKTKNKNNMQRF